MSLLKEILAETSEVGKVSELVLLLRCSQLPTIVVEEPSDVRIYNRWIDLRLFNTYNVNVLAAGGKANILSLYERRSEFAKLPVVFVANQGMWMFSGIPEEYTDMVCTHGYSIENDIYSISRIENLIHSDKSTDFWSVKESIITWFASEVEKVTEGNFQGIYPDLDDLVPKGQTKLNNAIQIGLHFVKSDIIDDIRNAYNLKLPGKLLFEIVARFSDISLNGLYNTAFVNYESEPQELIEKIKRNLGKHNSINHSSPKQQARDQNRSLLNINPTSESALSVVDNFAEDLASTSESALSVVDNFVENLRRTDTPTVVVEGKDSADIIEGLIEHLRLIEHKEHDAKVSVRHISGRDRLLAVYDRRDEFAHILPVAFVIDQEMWLFSKIPEPYSDIIWTDGYSLENDLYTDGDLENLIDPHETWKHQQVLNSVIRWFAFEVEEFLAGKTMGMDVELSDIVLPGQLELNENFCERHGFYEPQEKRVQKIKETYKRVLPGKFLFQILARFLKTRGHSFDFDVMHDIVLTVPEVKVRDIINAKILKNDGTKVTVQLMNEQPSYNLIQRIYQTLKLTNEEVTFEYQHYPGQVGDEHKMMVKSVDTGRVKELTPFQQEVKVGDKIMAKTLKKDGIKVTVQLNTVYNEEITFEYPYFRGQVGAENQLKVIAVDDTGRVTKVVP